MLAAAVLWGTTGTSQALAPTGAPSSLVGAIRLLVGGATLLVWVLFRDGFSAVRHFPVRATVLAGIGVAA